MSLGTALREMGVAWDESPRVRDVPSWAPKTTAKRPIAGLLDWLDGVVAQAERRCPDALTMEEITRLANQGMLQHPALIKAEIAEAKVRVGFQPRKKRLRRRMDDGEKQTAVYQLAAGLSWDEIASRHGVQSDWARADVLRYIDKRASGGAQ